jgi:DNA-binding transcriptional LysR family regulator
MVRGIPINFQYIFAMGLYCLVMEDRLKKFACLVDSGSFTAAAAKLHTSQPALTTAVQKLERELKVTLLVRGSRSVSLTPAGELAYAHGHALLLAEKNLLHELRELQQQKQPFTLGCIDSIAELVVATNLLAMLEEECSLTLIVQNSQLLLDAVKRGDIDMAVVATPAQLPAPGSYRKLGDETFVLVCRADRADAYVQHISAGSLPDFLAYNLGSTTQSLVAQQLQANGLHAEPRLFSTNPSVLLELAVQGRGVTALPYKLVKRALSQGLVELPLPKPIARPLMAVWQRDRKLPYSVEDFLDATQVQLL